jgi:hypothetical protein
MDIKNTKELCVFVCRAIDAGDSSMSDGQISVGDAANLISPLMSLPAAVEGISDLPKEISDLDPAEAEELKAVIASELDLRNDAVEAVAEQVVGVALQLAAAFIAMKQAKAA